jgi:hypothetical protein
MAKEYQTQAAKLGGSTSPQLAMVATSQGSDHAQGVPYSGLARTFGTWIA